MNIECVPKPRCSSHSLLEAERSDDRHEELELACMGLGGDSSRGVPLALPVRRASTGSRETVICFVNFLAAVPWTLYLYVTS